MYVSAPTESPDTLAEIRRLLSAPRLRTYREAAQVLGLSVSKLKRLVADRAIGVIRIGTRGIRFSQADIDAWVSRHRVPPARTLRGA